MKNPNCGGCPPCCSQCVFSSKGEPASDVILVQTAADYGCKKGHGDIVRDNQGRIGQQREGLFHFLSEAGEAFLRKTENPLLQT